MPGHWQHVQGSATQKQESEKNIVKQIHAIKLLIQNKILLYSDNDYQLCNSSHEAFKRWSKRLWYEYPSDVLLEPCTSWGSIIIYTYVTGQVGATVIMWTLVCAIYQWRGGYLIYIHVCLIIWHWSVQSMLHSTISLSIMPGHRPLIIIHKATLLPATVVENNGMCNMAWIVCNKLDWHFSPFTWMYTASWKCCHMSC